MNLKNFFLASLVIHIIGAIALYFYYNPIQLAPQPVGQFAEELSLESAEETSSPNFTESQQKAEEELQPKTKLPQKRLVESQTKSPKKKPHQTFRKKLSKKFLQGKNNKKSKQIDSALKKRPISVNVTPKQALSEARDLSPKIKSTFIETKNPAFDLELKEIKETGGEAEVKASSKSPVPVNTASSKPNSAVMGKEEIPTADMKEIETMEEMGEKTSPVPVKTASSKPKSAAMGKEEIPTTDREEIEIVEEMGEKTSPVPVKTAGSKPNSAAMGKEEIPPADREEIETVEEMGEKTGPVPVKKSKTKTNPPQSGASPNKTNFKSFKSLKQKRGNPALTYPDFARREKMEGTVSVIFFVSEQGLVDQIQLHSSSGHAKLDNYVLRQLARYEFLSGQESWVQYEILFKLEGTEKEYERLRRKEE